MPTNGQFNFYAWAFFESLLTKNVKSDPKSIF